MTALEIKHLIALGKTLDYNFQNTVKQAHFVKEISKNSKNSFSLWEKVGMRALKIIIYNHHPRPNPEGEGGG
ncbi:hypothetical protein [Methyloglobulus sp.]|uniref:hypothetical protein n=1 Tax=Methyloglobulus sp. TaxID=2518622 RepID=UPI0032B78957